MEHLDARPLRAVPLQPLSLQMFGAVRYLLHVGGAKPHIDVVRHAGRVGHTHVPWTKMFPLSRATTDGDMLSRSRNGLQSSSALQGALSMSPGPLTPGPAPAMSPGPRAPQAHSVQPAIGNLPEEVQQVIMKGKRAAEEPPGSTQQGAKSRRLG
eukprot:Opistho-1_new@104267